MVAELISVGTELLLGNIVNTNAAYLAGECAKLGLSCYYQTVVGDNTVRLKEAVTTALKRSDVVILSGGLGPTGDDLTKETTAQVLGRELVMDENWKRRLKDYFTSRNLDMTENNLKQAMVPKGAAVVENENGTAPGIIMEQDEKRVILLPGPPGELIPMFERQIAPYLKQLVPGTIYSKIVKICGIGESKAETMIKDLIRKQENPTIAPYAKTGEVHLRVTASADNEKEAKKRIRPVVKELRKRFGNHIYTTKEEVTLEKAVTDLLKERHLKLSTAESCTGGLLAGRLVNVPGVSGVFRSGYVTYSNKAKRELLRVKKKTLKAYGAVSGETALEMAKGAARADKTEAAVAVTGIAGPDGGTADKKVGLVYIACTVCGHSSVKEYQFSGDRAKIRQSAVAAALVLLRQCILEAADGIDSDNK